MKKTSSSTTKLRVGVDTGGTFTDFIYSVKGKWCLFKTPSTPDDPSRAIVAGMERIAIENGVSLKDLEVVHGTTVGTNALLQRRGAKIALVTTAGFEDVLEIGRQARPSLYDLAAQRPAPLAPRELRFGIAGRFDPAGNVVDELDVAALEPLVRRLLRANVDAIAVSLLFSFVDPRFEKAVVQALKPLGLPLSVSHEILPEYREFERTSTVCINAYLQPLMGDYLRRLQRRAPTLRVMQSSGGSISATVSGREPVRTILSGPAGGVVGAVRAAKASGFDRIMTFDMGGTSTDVALCDTDGLRMTREAVVAGVPVAIPMMDIHTVGAGGGSIARVDAGGSLRVGPESAGADPGPACYGRGLLPTVTDSHQLLGQLGDGGLLGGEFALDTRCAANAFTGLAENMSEASGRRVSIKAAALGVLDVVRAGLERTLRVISVERGFDARDFTLVSFGGAGGLHAVELARALRMPRVLVPASPGALSALGCLAANVVKDRSRTVMLLAGGDSNSRVVRTFNELERRATADLKREGFTISRQRHERILAVRYLGQSFELDISWTPNVDVAATFHAAHTERYGYAQMENPVEIVSARVRSSGLVDQVEIASSRRRSRGRVVSPNYYLPVHFGIKPATTGIYSRSELTPGAQLRSPCIVTEYSGTTLVPSGAKACIDNVGNLVIEP
ncbi:MAG: hydantoinase/oxoprolinase family protein [Pyrinomonadaceae bacterium]